MGEIVRKRLVELLNDSANKKTDAVKAEVLLRDFIETNFGVIDAVLEEK